jgi:hypothetical protein
MPEQRDDLFADFMAADVAEEWNKIRVDYEHKFLGQAAWTIPFGLEIVKNGEGDELDPDDPEVIQAFKDAPAETLWVERYTEADPVLADGLFGVSQMAYELCLVAGKSLPPESKNLYCSSIPWSTKGSPKYTLSWVVLKCPRCFIILEEEGEVLDEDNADPDCPACGGTGEWEFELPNI